MQTILTDTIFADSSLRGNTQKKRTQIANLQKTATTVGKAESFLELAAIILARSYQSNGRKKEARNLLTSYLLNNPATIGIITALNANDLA